MWSDAAWMLQVLRGIGDKACIQGTNLSKSGDLNMVAETEREADRGLFARQNHPDGTIHHLLMASWKLGTAKPGLARRATAAS